MKLCRTLILSGLLSSVAVSGSFAGHMQKSHKMSGKVTAAATQYECTHCNIKMSAKEAKAHGMKCDCGNKLTMVKKATTGKKA